MSHEFIAKNGLIINNSHPVNNISNKTTGIAYDENSLMTENSIRLAIEEYVPDLSFATGNGVVSGMTLSVNIVDNTKFDISSGIYYEKDNGYFDFGGITGITAINILTSSVSYIAYLHNIGIIQKIEHFTNEERRDYIILGDIVHSNNIIINTTNTLPDVSLNLTSQFNDFLDSLKVFNKDGNIISANGNNMFINKSEGCIFKRGVNSPNMNVPHNKKLPALNAPSDIRYRLSDSTEYSDTNTISLNYESSFGVLSPLPSNRFTIQRVVLFSSNLIRIQHGQFLYKSLTEAINTIYMEDYVYESNIARDGLLRCYLIIGGSTTTLNDTSNVFFLEADKFGTMPSSGIGGTTSLQGAYNNSPEPEIITNTTNGTLTIRNGELSDNVNLIEFQNNSGITVSYITGEGYIGVSDGINDEHAINLSQFSAHTGDTTIHYTKNSINITDLGISAHTHIINDIINLQTTLDNKTDDTEFYSHTGNTSNPHGTTLDNLTDTILENIQQNELIIYSAGTWQNTGISTIGDEFYLQKINNLTDLSNIQTSLNNLTNASGSTNEFVLTKDTETGNAIFKQFPKRHYPYSFSLPEDITNTSVYFYPWVKGTTNTDNIRSGNSNGLSYQGSCNPIQLHDNGKLISANLTLKGAGVASNTVTYPVIYRAELWNVGWTTEGTKITDLNFQITSGVGNYSVGATNAKVNLTGLNISVSLGDLLAVKFVNGTGNSEVGHMLNAFITIEIEEN